MQTEKCLKSFDQNFNVRAFDFSRAWLKQEKMIY